MGNSVFLLIALAFLIMKEVSAIKCTETTYANCFDKTGKKEVIECFHSLKEQERTLKGDIKCIRVTYKFEDNSEVVIKSFDGDPDDMCKGSMSSIKTRLEEATKMKVKDFNCDNCNEDNCNNKSEQKKSKRNEANEANAKNAAILMSLMSLLVYLLF